MIAALSHYRGELLPGWYDDWVVLERERVSAVFEQKMARLRNVSTLRAQLVSKTLERAWAKGAGMTLEQAIDHALEIQTGD